MFRILSCAVIAVGLSASSVAEVPSSCAGGSGPLLNEAVAPSVISSRENFERISGPLHALDQLSGLFFDWKSGGQRDLDCFVAGELAAIPPEVLVWEVPGEIVSGVDYNRLAPLFVEAIRELGCQVETCYQLLQSVAEKFERLDKTVTEHGGRLDTQDASICAIQTQVSEHQTSLTLQQQQIELLEQRNEQLAQEIEALREMIQQMSEGASGE